MLSFIFLAFSLSSMVVAMVSKCQGGTHGSQNLTQVERSQAQGLLLPWLLFLPQILLEGYQ